MVGLKKKKFLNFYVAFVILKIIICQHRSFDPENLQQLLENQLFIFDYMIFQRSFHMEIRNGKWKTLSHIQD